jgi:hypothetical protein
MCTLTVSRESDCLRIDLTYRFVTDLLRHLSFQMLLRYRNMRFTKF